MTCGSLPPHPVGLPHYLRQQVALRSAPGPPWPFPGGPLFFRNMRALALDVGSKTIGLALTDEARIAAHPLTVLQRVGNFGDARAVLAVVLEHAVTDIVVGIPFELSGKIGHRARRVQAF